MTNTWQVCPGPSGGRRHTGNLKLSGSWSSTSGTEPIKTGPSPHRMGPLDSRAGFQLRSNGLKLLQRGFQVIGDFVGQHIGFGEVGAVFQALVLQPEDVEV